MLRTVRNRRADYVRDIKVTKRRAHFLRSRQREALDEVFHGMLLGLEDGVGSYVWFSRCHIC